MKLGWFSDPHLGIERLANTTVESRRRFRKTVFLRTVAAINLLRDKGARKIFCNGDLFDTYSNNEETILEGEYVIDIIDGVMAGNHDVKNDTSSIGTLRMFSQFRSWDELKGKIIHSPEPNRPGAWTHHISDEIKIVFVPHVLNQELFEQSLVQASHLAKGTKLNILCLHCNVGEYGFKEVTKEGTSLHLTDEFREECEKSFDFILIGHEHPPKRVSEKTHILGNVMPLTFGEMGDRFAYVLDTDTKELTAHRIFQKDYEFIALEAKEILTSVPVFQQEYLYADIQGVLAHTDIPHYIRQLAAFWKLNSTLLMVRNGAQSIGAAEAQKSAATFIPKTLPELVTEAIEQTQHVEAYKEAMAETIERADRASAGKPKLSG